MPSLPFLALAATYGVTVTPMSRLQHALPSAHAFRAPREAILRMSAAGVGGYWDSRREMLLRDLQRRELELDELASREQAMMPMLGASAGEREKTSYAMGMAAEARAQAVAADASRIAALTAAAAAPPAAAPAPELGGAHAPAWAGGEVDGQEAPAGDAELVESAWRELLARERAAASEALQAERAKHELELQSTANFWLARVNQAQQEARRAGSAAREPGEGVLATGGKWVPDHDDAVSRVGPAGSDQEGVSTVSAEAVATLEAELFALEADYEAISDQCEVMRETLTMANERLVQMQNEMDEEELAAEVSAEYRGGGGEGGGCLGWWCRGEVRMGGRWG